MWTDVYGGVLARCRSCGIVATVRTPTFVYANSYFTGSDEGGYDFHASLAHAIDAARFGAELQRLEAQGLRGTVLDIGCATGTFLLHAKARGWQVSGVELAEYARAYTSRVVGVPVAASLADLPAGARFDVVTLHHVLEHHTDPSAFLRDDVRPRVGRRLVIEVPNFRSLASQVYGRHWRDLRIDQHVCHYEPRTLGTLVSAAGFHVADVYTLWEPLWSLRTALETVMLLAAAVLPGRGASVADTPPSATETNAVRPYSVPRGVKRVATETTRLAFFPLIRALEAARLGCRLVIEAEPT
jgi:SAM-dependent methyltransferase